MMLHLDHIAIKVSDLPAVRVAFEAMNLNCTSLKNHPEVGMEIAFFDTGETSIEVLRAVDDNSPIHRDPDGLHHLCLKAWDIEAAFAAISQNDLFHVEAPIGQGAHSKIFFFRIKAQNSILFECGE